MPAGCLDYNDDKISSGRVFKPYRSGHLETVTSGFRVKMKAVLEKAARGVSLKLPVRPLGRVRPRSQMELFRKR